MAAARFNYQVICRDLIKNLPERQQGVLVQRFGLDKEEPKTLEAIGQKYEITRERVRQIEEDGLKKAKSCAQTKAQKVFQYFFDHLNSSGSLQREDILLTKLGGKNFQKH